MNTRTRLKLIILGSSALIMIMANTMLFPVFPQMRKALDVGLRDISLLVLVVALPAALLNPLAGYLADIWGRKRIMVPSIILYGISGGLAGVSIVLLEEPFNAVLFFRFLQGIGSASPMYLAVALAGDIFQSQERNKAMGFIETANGIGKVISPIIGGALGFIAWYAPFFFYPAISIPIALGLWLFIQEPPLQEKVTLGSELESCRRLITVSHLLALLTAAMVIFAVYGAMFWLGEYLENIYPEGTIIHGFLISVPVAALIGTALFSSWFTDWLGARYTLTAGLLTIGFSLFILPLSLNNPPLLWATIVLLGAGGGLLLPTLDTISTAVSSRGHRGVITSIFGGFRCLGAALAPFVIAVLLEINIFATFLPLSAVVTALGLAMAFFSRENRLIPPQLK